MGTGKLGRVREEMGEGGEDMQQRTTAWNQPWPAEDSIEVSYRGALNSITSLCLHLVSTTKNIN